MSDTPQKPNKHTVDRYQKPAYSGYVLLVLTIVYSFNFIDRQLLVILQESIKQEMLLSDTQLGLLTGFAFALFYVVAGIPIARWADRSNRRNIISIAIGLWSFMTAISGLAANYVQLLLARIGVGLGEAGGSPPAHSMISDMYPPEKRATAIAAYSVGVNIGILFGFLLGGILNEYFGWRVAFIVVGAPGILLALWIRFTVDEPIRGKFESEAVSQEEVPIKVVFDRLFNDKVIRHLTLGSALAALVGYGSLNWIAPMFIRLHGMGTAELGTWLAISAGVFGGAGTFAAGYACDKLGKIDKRWYLWVPAIAVLIAFPCQLYILTTENATSALLVNVLFSFMGTAYMGSAVATIHGRVSPRMRAMASAMLFFVLNIVGLGLGAPLIGVISDALADTYGVESIRYAMLYVLPAGCLWAAAHFFWAAKYMRLEAK